MTTLSRWAKEQSKRLEKFTKDNAQYAPMARKLHRLYQAMALPQTTFSRDPIALSNYLSIETSSFWPHLVATARIVIDNGIDPKTYLQAQFRYFKDTFRTLPKPNQLHTPNAVNRFIDFAGTLSIQQEERAPRTRVKTSAKSSRAYWAERIARLSRRPGLSDEEALIAHCISFPAHVLVDFGVWDVCKKKWERAHREA